LEVLEFTKANCNQQLDISNFVKEHLYRTGMHILYLQIILIGLQVTGVLHVTITYPVYNTVFQSVMYFA